MALGPIEPTRTNLFTRSAEFDHADWTKTAMTVSADAGTAPDGTATADKLVESATTAVHVLSRSMSVVSGLPYATSFHVKAAGRLFARMELATGGWSSNPRCNFNLTDGLVASSAGTALFQIQALADDWFRIAIIATATATASAAVSLILGTQSYAGDGTSGLLAWGAQCEVGAFVSSYIPTGAATATRTQPRMTLSPVRELVRSPVRHPAPVA